MREGPSIGVGDEAEAMTATTRTWLELPGHRAWLAAEEDRLTRLAMAAAAPSGGFAWLDDHCRPDPERPAMTWVTARMTHVLSLAHLRGVPGAGPLADHGLAALAGPLRDPDHDGWYPGLAPGGGPNGTDKNAYEHAFVVLAAGTATAAGRPGAADLLRDALAVVEERFWDSSAGLARESWNRAWTETEPYRGANSNMHLVEAFLAAGSATGETVWHERALGIAERLVHTTAAAHDWRLPEHFTPEWRPVLEYNASETHHQFRPYGTTVGHWLEWARLLLHLEAACGADAPAWLLHDARALFDASVDRGWRADGSDGFVYTLDWDDHPVVRERMHWVIAEAVLAAAVLARRTGEAGYEHWYRTWWDHVALRHIDRVNGGWHHELDPDGRPSRTVWSGKPDVYHAYQAVLLPRYPIAAAPAAALSHDHRDGGPS